MKAISVTFATIKIFAVKQHYRDPEYPAHSTGNKKDPIENPSGYSKIVLMNMINNSETNIKKPGDFSYAI